MRPLILIVEDDTNAREGLMDFLACEGLVVRGAASADEGLTIAIESPPAAVVTDIQLPGTSGFDLAEMLRHRTETRNIPVIGLTGHWSPEVSSRAARAGMLTILMKPCQPAHLLAELRRLLTDPPLPGTV